MDRDKFPPDDFIRVGDYAFKPPHVPTVEQIEEAEQFIFSNEAFVPLEESQRRRNVIRLAIAAATSQELGDEEGSRQISFIPLIGGTAKVVATRHEGTPVFHCELIVESDE